MLSEDFFIKIGKELGNLLRYQHYGTRFFTGCRKIVKTPLNQEK